MAKCKALTGSTAKWLSLDVTCFNLLPTVVDLLHNESTTIKNKLKQVKFQLYLTHPYSHRLDRFSNCLFTDIVM